MGLAAAPRMLVPDLGAGPPDRRLADPGHQQLERGFVGERGLAGQHVGPMASTLGSSSAVALPTQPGSVERSSWMPSGGKMRD